MRGRVRHRRTGAPGDAVAQFTGQDGTVFPGPWSRVQFDDGLECWCPDDELENELADVPQPCTCGAAQTYGRHLLGRPRYGDDVPHGQEAEGPMRPQAYDPADPVDGEVLELTPRQVRLLWEALTMVDEDVLSANCSKIGVEPPSGHEVTQLMEVLDPGEEFLAEWMRRDEK